jgi:hypothetical protein
MSEQEPEKTAYDANQLRCDDAVNELDQGLKSLASQELEAAKKSGDIEGFTAVSRVYRAFLNAVKELNSTVSSAMLSCKALSRKVAHLVARIETAKIFELDDRIAKLEGEVDALKQNQTFLGKLWENRSSIAVILSVCLAAGAAMHSQLKASMLDAVQLRKIIQEEIKKRDTE